MKNGKYLNSPKLNDGDNSSLFSDLLCGNNPKVNKVLRESVALKDKKPSCLSDDVQFCDSSDEFTFNDKNIISNNQNSIQNDNNCNRIFEYIVDEKYDGKSVLDILKKELNLSNRLIKRLKTEDGLKLNNKHIRTIDTVTLNDVLTIEQKAGVSENIIPVKLDFETIYEDEDILVVNKPANMPVHPSKGNFYNTLANAVYYKWSNLGKSYIYRSVNRLDGNTTGLMIIAKNSHAHHILSEQIKQKELKRTYLAITNGIPSPKEGTIDLPIKRASDSIITRIVAVDGKRAVTNYKVIDQRDNYALLLINLETGRTHQIRVHFSYINTPIVADGLYGAKYDKYIERHALHSYKLEFFHPITNEKMIFSAGLPKDMRKIFDFHSN